MARTRLPLSAQRSACHGWPRTETRCVALLVTHCTLNIGLLALSVGLAVIRARSRRPSAGYLLAGLVGAALVTYSGYLGGQMVYTHGVGVTPVDGIEPERTPEMPHDGFGSAAQTAAGNVGQALKHTAQEMAQGEIAPRFQERPSAGEPTPG